METDLVYTAKCANHGSNARNPALSQRLQKQHRYPPHQSAHLSPSIQLFSSIREARENNMSEKMDDRRTTNAEEDSDDDEEEEEEEEPIIGLNLIPSFFRSEAPSREAMCNCLEVKCGILPSCQTCASNGGNSGSSSYATVTPTLKKVKTSTEDESMTTLPQYLSSNALYSRLHAPSSELEKLQLELIRQTGGHSAAISIYDKSHGLSKRHANVLSCSASPDGDTVLMQLCTRTPKDKESQELLSGQILAFIRLYVENDQSLLFVRNTTGLNALAIAGITNKRTVSHYLVRLYQAMDQDLNEQNAHGQTLLHLLARQGDSCSDTLDLLLNLKHSVMDKTRLFRYDVVDQAQRTPLDEAMTSANIYSTGKSRRVFQETVRLFYDVIQEDAAQLVEGSQDHNRTTSSSSSSTLTFRNF
ncbi:uncharacterized protein LOC131880845 [Tigriopus californicus]|uniref:uncharacterized protein LOC131880845 n=1 Tax=Tigriopus californicus TaxID=6832 RepID=UPI0027D9E22D|nr:uncharacterized protein LOC131880845 [Tigriopus californicus]